MARKRKRKAGSACGCAAGKRTSFTVRRCRSKRTGKFTKGKCR